MGHPRGFVALLGAHVRREALLAAAAPVLGRAYGAAPRRVSEAAVVVGDGDALAASVGVHHDIARVDFDAENGSHRLFADAFGRRSIYAALVGDACLVATRLDPIVAALAAIGRRPAIDPAALRAFLSLSFVPAPRSPYRGIVAIPAGHACTFTSHVGLSSPERVPDPPVDLEAPSDEAAPALLEDAIAAAVESVLPSAGSTAIFLSGGLDSAVVAIIAARLRPSLRAVTIDFDEGSEVDVAGVIAEAAGLPQQRVFVTAAHARDAIEGAIAALDCPIGDPVIVPFWVAARALGKTPTTVLTGEGGDQLFAGWATKPMLAWARYAASDEDPTPTYLRTFHKLAEVEGEALGPFFRDVDDRLAGDAIRPFLRGERAVRRTSFLHRLCDANLWLKGAQNVLPRVDRVVAAAGHDVQSPLVDHRVVAASFALAPDQKQRNTTEKWVLRKLLAGRLPGSVLDLPKRGMRVPLGLWGATALHDFVRDVLSPRAVRERGVFDEGFVARLLEGDVRASDLRRRRRDEWLWIMLATELWLRAHA